MRAVAHALRGPAHRDPQPLSGDLSDFLAKVAYVSGRKSPKDGEAPHSVVGARPSEKLSALLHSARRACGLAIARADVRAQT